jgi:hypothetical protein
MKADDTSPCGASVGAMLRRCREARGLSVERVAAAWAEATGCMRGAAGEAIRANERDSADEPSPYMRSCAIAHTEALARCEPLSSQERDAILCAARVVPPDLASLLLANSDRLDAVRALLDPRNCRVCGDRLFTSGDCITCIDRRATGSAK